MLLDPYQFAPQLVVKGNAPHAEDQFMQALAMLGVDAQTGIDILIDEDVIEDSDVRQAAVPCAILEDRSGWSADTVHNHMRRVLRSHPPAYGTGPGTSEARRVGNEGVRSGRYRWLP